jgi:Rho-type GTPase-activating protein 1/2
MRFDNIKIQYEGELLPLTTEKEAIRREITELKAMRDAVLAETVAISARNEALAQLNAQYSNVRTDATGSDQSHDSDKRDGFFENPQSFGTSTVSSSTAFSDESVEHRKLSKSDTSETQISNTVRPTKFRWPGSKAQPQTVGMKEPHSLSQEPKSKAHVEHNFQQISGLRVARCDHCGDKMWGSQLRCTCELSHLFQR